MILPPWMMPMRRTFWDLSDSGALIGVPSERGLVDGVDDLGDEAVLELEALKVQVRALEDVEGLGLLDLAFDLELGEGYLQRFEDILKSTLSASKQKP